MSGIEKRKLRHIDVSLTKNVDTDIPNGFQDIRLIHKAIPEINLDEVNPEITLFGKKLSAPLIISAITMKIILLILTLTQTILENIVYKNVVLMF